MKNIKIITIYTFIESYRSKLMYSLVMFAIMLVILVFLASEFTYGATAKIALDVGYGFMSIINLVIALFLGSTLMIKEIEQKTLYMILSKSISRQEFILGKILGLSSVLVINTIVLSMLSLFLFLKNGGVYSDLILWTALFSFFESLIVLVLAVLFSLFTNTIISVLYTTVVFITGHAVNETSKTALVKLTPGLDIVIKFISVIVPNFYRLNFKDFLIYEQSISQGYIFNTILYSLLMLIGLMSLVLLIFKNKNLD